MEATINQMKALGARLSTESTMAPRQVLHALQSLLRDRVIQQLAFSVQRVETPAEANGSREGWTVWRSAALTESALVYVEASNPETDWDFETSDRGETTLAGRLYPLSEISSCGISEIMSRQIHLSLARGVDNHAWDSRWSVYLRDGSQIDIPWSKDPDAREAHEALGRAIADRLAPQ